MNPELRRLLEEGGVEDELGRFPEWSDIVLVNNVGEIPPGRDEPGDFRWNRGFNCIVLGDNRQPALFCKLRHPGVCSLTHETEVLKALGSVPDLRTHVATTRSAQSERIEIQITRHVPGRTLVEWFRGQPDDRIAATIRDGLETSLLVSRRANEHLAHLLRSPEEVDLAAEAAAALRHLGPAGLEPRELEILDNALAEAPGLPRSLQHGDLWPGNVLHDGQSLWFLDFEIFGEIQVPLYDVFHFSRTCLGTADEDSGADNWFERLRGPSPLAVQVRRAIADSASSIELTPAQTRGALIYYAVDFLMRIHQRGASRLYWEPALRATRDLAATLGRGEDPLAG